MLLWILLGVSGVVFLLSLLRSSRPYLPGLDSVFLSGDKHDLIVVQAVLTTKTPLTFDAFRAMIEAKIICHPRFRQRIVRRRFRWHYFDVDSDSAFRLEQHMRTHQLTKPKPGETEQRMLEEYVSQMSMTPIDLTKPAFEFILIPHYKGGSAVLFRVHHAIADGISLMRLAMTIFHREEQGNNTLHSPGLNLMPEEGEKLRMASPAPSSSAPPATFHAAAHYKKPRPPMPKTLSEKGVAAVKAGWNLLTLPSDPVSLYKPKTPLQLGMPMHAAWLSEPLPLAELKQMSYATGTSVNDVLFCVAAAALRTHALSSGLSEAEVQKMCVQSIMWVSLQGTEIESSTQSFSGGNRVGAAYLRLPVSASDDLHRLRSVRDLTSSLQSSPAPLVASFLLRVLGLIPQAPLNLVWEHLAYKTTISMSNVPGPQFPVTWGPGGPELSELLFFVAPQHTIASFITIISYNGNIQMGYLADERVVKDPRDVIKLFSSEYHKLKNQIAELQQQGKLEEVMELQPQYRVR